MNTYRIRAVWPPLTLLLASCAVAATAPLPLAILATAFGVLMVIDVNARLNDYDKAVKFLLRDSSRPIWHRIGVMAAQHRHTWCQREVAKAAAETVVSNGAETVELCYASLGYRWYHVFPDGAFTAKSPFLSGKWWRGFFGLSASKSLR